MQLRCWNEEQMINDVVEGLASLVSNIAGQSFWQGSTHQVDLGQPYAFRQAGLTMGIILLVALTITVRHFRWHCAAVLLYAYS